MPKKLLYLTLACLIGIVLLIGCGQVNIKNPLVKVEPPTVTSIDLDGLPLNLRKLHTPPLAVQDSDKILNFFVQRNIYYLALRSPDGESSTVQAFENKDGILTPYKKFGTDGILTLKARMLLGVTLGLDGVIYYIRDGVHTLKAGNDIISYQGKTTATKLALLPGEHQAYLYGNDNFTKSDIKDDAFENNTTSFLHNRAAPFKGGLAFLQVNSDGTIYAGGRARPNGSSIIAGFDKNGKLLCSYGKPKATAKSSITNLVDMAVLKNYVCAIDGFTLKLWKIDGTYLGSFNVSKILGNNLNAGKLTPIDDNTLGIIGYLRDEKTKQVNLSFFSLSFPELAVQKTK